MARTRMKHFVTGLCFAALTLPAVPAAASTLTDLEGVRASAAENTIRSRGYHSHHSSPGGGGRYTYWWNNSTKSCVRTLTSNGVISGTKTVGGSDCGYYGSGSASGSSGDKAAGVALAAAALIGVAALAQKSHHREDKDYQDANSYADFERGHRDGLYNHSYSNYSRSSAYSDGYRSGVSERGQQSSYRNSSYYRGGYATQQSFSDLAYADRQYAQNELQNRGFQKTAEANMPGGGHNYTYWNSSSQQCVSAVSRNNQIIDIHEIRDSNCR